MSGNTLIQNHRLISWKPREGLDAQEVKDFHHNFDKLLEMYHQQGKYTCLFMEQLQKLNCSQTFSQFHSDAPLAWNVTITSGHITFYPFSWIRHQGRWVPIEWVGDDGEWRGANEMALRDCNLMLTVFGEELDLRSFKEHIVVRHWEYTSTG